MKHHELVIVGAGPAGIAAAQAASKVTRSILVIDDNHTPGGQIWRGSGISLPAEFLPTARVIDGNAGLKNITVESREIETVAYNQLILATGGRERFLPFPGWTLPNVFGVGGLQALAKSGLSVEGKRVIVAGSGPLLLAVAAYLQNHGAIVPLVAEQTSWLRLARFGVTLLEHPEKVKQALAIRLSLHNTRYIPNCWVREASGDAKLGEVTLQHAGRQFRERCDFLAVAYGFVPNTELAELMGCELKGGFVKVDAAQKTSVQDIFCAGEITGLGGVDESSLEGEIAGRTATGQSFNLNRSKTKRFSRALETAFELRQELSELPAGDTLICRCEDVPLSRIQGKIKSWSEAKLHYRCGMGTCQGRICGPIIEHYFGFAPDSVRPPIFPTRLSNLVDIKETIRS